ncbi:MAG: 2Fe-2S iron-sulfur cluster-binding protein [Pseudomonadota bacterium]
MPQKRICLKIDGREIHSKEGITILEAAKLAGIPIPHICTHKALSNIECCRMCLVKISGYDPLQPACTTEVLDGMIVETNNEEVKKSRVWNLKYHLINHPAACHTCEKTGECKLQDLYMKYGLYSSDEDSRQKSTRFYPINKHVILDYSKCILCGRCAIFLREYFAFEIPNSIKNKKTLINISPPERVTGNYTLNLTDLCPTGALISRDFRHRSPVWKLAEFDSICIGCGTGCNIKFCHRENVIHRIIPRYNEKINKFFMCDHGRSIYHHHNIENRLSSPLKKVKKAMLEIEWTEAITDISTEIKKRIAFKQNNKIAVVMTPSLSLEDLFSIEYIFRQKLKANIFLYTNNDIESLKKDKDNFLIHQEKNPNTAGINFFENQFEKYLPLDTLEEKDPDIILFFSPGNSRSYPSLENLVQKFCERNKFFIYAASNLNFKLKKASLILPLKTYIEKKSTFINKSGIIQKQSLGISIVENALSVFEFCEMIEVSIGKFTLANMLSSFMSQVDDLFKGHVNNQNQQNSP